MRAPQWRVSTDSTSSAPIRVRSPQASSSTPRKRRTRSRLPDCTTTLVVAGIKRRVDRKSTRLNSSHVEISYAVFCLKKKKKKKKKKKTQKKNKEKKKQKKKKKTKKMHKI